MSASLPQSHSNSVAGSPRSATGWLFAPWVDLLFVANVAWPLVLLSQLSGGFDGHSSLQFWQVYYVTTPHRWITLLLVFGDSNRFRERRVAFLGVAAVILAACLGIRFTTGALTCLLAVDYVWNAWHFAAQHHGIYRIYDRAENPDRASGITLEKWAMRGFILYTALRVASATWTEAEVEQWLDLGDWIVVVIPVWLMLRELVGADFALQGRRAYLLSVCLLYTALLAAVHARTFGLVLALTTASALFHATEYLALVSWSVRRRHSSAAGQTGLLGILAARWGGTLAVFVLILGAAGWLLDQRYVDIWLTANVVVAFLHYAYDGMIWRRRASS